MSNWQERLHGPVMFIEGNDEEFRGQVCITSDTRPSPRHAWERAEVRIWQMNDVHLFVRIVAAGQCARIVQLLASYDRLKPPQFSWKGIEGKL